MTDRAPESRPALPRRHPTPVILIHWLTVALVLAGVALVLAHQETGARELKRLLLEQHRSIGLLVLGLVGLRLLTRLWHRRRLARHDLPWLLGALANLGHLGLYLLMVATPLLGWALTNAHGHAATLFGLVNLPPLVEADDDLADSLGDWHQISAWTLVGLIGAHALAALWHHIVRRDGVLHAMLPLVAPPARAADSEDPS